MVSEQHNEDPLSPMRNPTMLPAHALLWAMNLAHLIMATLRRAFHALYGVFTFSRQPKPLLALGKPFRAPTSPAVAVAMVAAHPADEFHQANEVIAAAPTALMPSAVQAYQRSTPSAHSTLLSPVVQALIRSPTMAAMLHPWEEILSLIDGLNTPSTIKSHDAVLSSPSAYCPSLPAARADEGPFLSCLGPPTLLPSRCVSHQPAINADGDAATIATFLGSLSAAAHPRVNPISEPRFAGQGSSAVQFPLTLRLKQSHVSHLHEEDKAIHTLLSTLEADHGHSAIQPAITSCAQSKAHLTPLPATALMQVQVRHASPCGLSGVASRCYSTTTSPNLVSQTSPQAHQIQSLSLFLGTTHPHSANKYIASQLDGGIPADINAATTLSTYPLPARRDPNDHVSHVQRFAMPPTHTPPSASSLVLHTTCNAAPFTFTLGEATCMPSAFQLSMPGIPAAKARLRQFDSQVVELEAHLSTTNSHTKSNWLPRPPACNMPASPILATGGAPKATFSFPEYMKAINSIYITPPTSNFNKKFKLLQAPTLLSALIRITFDPGGQGDPSSRLYSELDSLSTLSLTLNQIQNPNIGFIFSFRLRGRMCDIQARENTHAMDMTVLQSSTKAAIRAANLLCSEADD
ncbi:hypothetical protein L7F22_038294 [Adiantum nelumboides]|nr:hypothetical protein [Adiantum nelumboides]